MPLATSRSTQSATISSGTKSNDTRFFDRKNELNGVCRDALAQQADALPGVLLEEAHADIELDGGDRFDSLESDSVHEFGDRQHVCGRHAGRPQALVGVAKGLIDDLDFRRRPV